MFYGRDVTCNRSISQYYVHDLILIAIISNIALLIITHLLTHSLPLASGSLHLPFTSLSRAFICDFFKLLRSFKFSPPVGAFSQQLLQFLSPGPTRSQFHVARETGRHLHGMITMRNVDCQFITECMSDDNC